MLLEVPVFDIGSAVMAAQAGAHRLELCADLHAGGTTPSPGFFQQAKKLCSIPMFVMIRPRGGGFIYTEAEKELIKTEVAYFKNAGADGLVFGALLENNKIDIPFCKEVLDLADGLPCTFHRAFDLVANPLAALDQIIDLGFARLLTSGGAPDVASGMSQIVECMKIAGDRLIVIPGGGLKKEQLPQLQQTGFLKEIHAGCKKLTEEKTVFSDGSPAFFGIRPGIDKACIVDLINQLKTK